MEWLWICLGVVVGIAFLVLLTALICFFRVFYAPKRKVLREDEYEIPEGKIYEAYREPMINWTKMIRSIPHEEVSITSFDGLTLRGKYYEYQAGAPVELLFHGYKGNAERDLSGGVERCFALGRSVILIDHRASGRSDGHVISFGINERRDCLGWINFAIERFGKDVKLMISGVSMGAATVMMAAGEELPSNVVCVLADCGYTSAKEIIMKVMKEMKLPEGLLYPFVKLGARIYGGFDLEETSPMEALRKSRVPVILLHGDTDDFVPWDMSRRLYEVCASQKKFVTIAGAGHGLAFPADREGYIRAVKEFEDECGFLK